MPGATYNNTKQTAKTPQRATPGQGQKAQLTPQQAVQVQVKLMEKRKKEFDDIVKQVQSEGDQEKKDNSEEPGTDQEKEEQDQEKDEPAQPVTPRANPPPKAKPKKPTPIKTKGRKWR